MSLDVGSTFEAALAADAAVPPVADRPAPAAAPPRKSDNPDAPHGLGEDGKPLAPYGHKADGRPRIKPGGPGRARDPDDKARVAPIRPSSPSSPSSGPAAAADYTEALTELATSVWLTGSMMRGGRLIILPVPDMRPYAAVFRQHIPSLASAWNVAAQHDASVRGWVERATGDGVLSWRLRVTIASVAFAAGCAEIAKAPADVKHGVALGNDEAVAEFMAAQVAELGLAADGAEEPGGQHQAAAA